MALRLVSGAQSQGPRLPDEQRARATARAARGWEPQWTHAVTPDLVW